MTESGVGARPAVTTMQAFQKTLDKYGSANALHFKQDGEWYVKREGGSVIDVPLLGRYNYKQASY